MSATIEAKTKGIWIWCVPHPRLKGRCLVLMDTEGLGDPMKVQCSICWYVKTVCLMQFVTFSKPSAL